MMSVVSGAPGPAYCAKRADGYSNRRPNTSIALNGVFTIEYRMDGPGRGAHTDRTPIIVIGCRSRKGYRAG
jgi:hypothetical protein